jgi:hypothetical protein
MLSTAIRRCWFVLSSSWRSWTISVPSFVGAAPHPVLAPAPFAPFTLIGSQAPLTAPEHTTGARCRAPSPARRLAGPQGREDRVGDQPCARDRSARRHLRRLRCCVGREADATDRRQATSVERSRRRASVRPCPSRLLLEAPSPVRRTYDRSRMGPEAVSCQWRGAPCSSSWLVLRHHQLQGGWTNRMARNSTCPFSQAFRSVGTPLSDGRVLCIFREGARKTEPFKMISLASSLRRGGPTSGDRKRSPRGAIRCKQHLLLRNRA